MVYNQTQRLVTIDWMADLFQADGDFEILWNRTLFACKASERAIVKFVYAKSLGRRKRQLTLSQFLRRLESFF